MSDGIQQSHGAHLPDAERLMLECAAKAVQGERREALSMQELADRCDEARSKVRAERRTSEERRSQYGGVAAHKAALMPARGPERRISPAIGDYALQERPALLARIAQLEGILRSVEGWMVECHSETDEGVLSDMREQWPAEWAIIDMIRAALWAK